MAAAAWCRLLAVVVLLMSLLGSAVAPGGAVSRPRPQRPPPKKPKVEPIDTTPPAPDIDIQQMMGTWYLLIAGSKCPYLLKHGTKVEPTVMTLSPSSTSETTISVSTKTRHNHQCWEIRQVYTLSTTPGRMTLKGTRLEQNTEIVIAETDYHSYAVIYYQKRGKMTAKLYVRSVGELSEPVLSKFEQLAGKHNIGLAFLFSFPTYSQCGDVDEDHVINCVPTC